MTAKTFEIRDVATFIPVLAIQLSPACEADRYLLARAGYSRQPIDQGRYVMVARLAGGVGQATSDPYEWGNRTMQWAHKYIQEHFNALESGAVIDVEYISGLSMFRKRSESEEHAL